MRKIVSKNDCFWKIAFKRPFYSFVNYRNLDVELCAYFHIS